MQKYLLILAILILNILLSHSLGKSIEIANVIVPARAVSPVEQSNQRRLVFSDDFNGSSLDSGKWTTCYWWDNGGCTIATNNEMEWYQPDEVLVSNGTLKLRARPRTIIAPDGRTFHYTSGMISSGRSTSDTSQPIRFAFQYGYAEMRARVPKGQGLWPAFWMLPADHNSEPEIDVMEILGHDTHTTHMNFHYVDDNGNDRSSGSDWSGPDFAADWHTYAVDWQPNAIIWYVDGVERKRYTDINHISAEPMYLLANLAVGGDWPGPPDNSTPFPAYFEIDYIKVWQQKYHVCLMPVADTFVDRSHPTENFGSDDSLYVDGNPTKISYLKFDTRSLDGEVVTSAKLRIRTTADTGAESPDTQRIKLINDSSWSEGATNYNNKPAVSSVILGSIAETLPNTTYDIPLNVALLQPKIGRVFSLAFDSAEGDGLYFYSKENTWGQPQILITTTHDNTIYCGSQIFLPLILKGRLARSKE